MILDKGRTKTVRHPHPHNRTPSQPGDRWGLNEHASSLIRRRQRRAGVIGCALEQAGDGISDHAGQGPTRPWRGFKGHLVTHGPASSAGFSLPAKANEARID